MTIINSEYYSHGNEGIIVPNVAQLEFGHTYIRNSQTGVTSEIDPAFEPLKPVKSGDPGK